MRILGLDVGSKTIGVACSDALLITAQGVETIRRKSDEADFARLHELIKEKRSTLHRRRQTTPYDGDYSDNMKHIEEFVQTIPENRPERRHCLLDERLTTIMAQNVLKEGNVRREKRKQFVDKMAAILILQNYLDAHAH